MNQAVCLCVFVTISEKRGIVYTEHMLVAVAAEAKRRWRGEETGLPERGSAPRLPLLFGEVVKPQMCRSRRPPGDGRANESEGEGGGK